MYLSSLLLQLSNCVSLAIHRDVKPGEISWVCKKVENPVIFRQLGPKVNKSANSGIHDINKGRGMTKVKHTATGNGGGGSEGEGEASPECEKETESRDPPPAGVGEGRMLLRV